MANSVLADTGFIVALLSRSDQHHKWAVSQAQRLPPPWQTCDAVLSEAFYLLGRPGRPALISLLARSAATPAFALAENLVAVLKLLQKYANVPMSLADACLVRMTEIVAEPLLLTTDGDFCIYRRHGRQTVPCILPFEKTKR
jgi:uncharacterized protein